MKNENMQNLLDSASGLTGSMLKFSPRAMGPWQILGFFTGCICGGIEPSESEDDEWLAAELLDEMARMEDDDEPQGFDEGPSAECIEALSNPTLDLYRRMVEVLAREEGALEPGFADVLEKTGGKDPGVMSLAREYCRGILRGIPFAVEDDDELDEDRWSEPLGLLFILAEEDLGPGFGSAEELRQARISVATGLAGICAQLYGNGMGE